LPDADITDRSSVSEIRAARLRKISRAHVA
jgi:hypothetical protein